MTHASFLFAVLCLAAPGPTNTLMALAGAQGGFQGPPYLRRDAGLYDHDLPLAYLGAATLDRWPAASALLKIAAASWVLYLALRLWSAQQGAGIVQITPRRVVRFSIPRRWWSGSFSFPRRWPRFPVQAVPVLSDSAVDRGGMVWRGAHGRQNGITRADAGHPAPGLGVPDCAVRHAFCRGCRV
jgi:hypothetical protein